MKFNKLLLKDFEKGELNLFALVILLSVIAVSSAIFLSQGVYAGLNEAAGTIIGGDRVLSSPDPIAIDIENYAKQQNISVSHTMTFLTMLSHDDDLALAEIKAVDNHYPLKGVLKGSDHFFGNASELESKTETILPGIPPPNTIWMELSLFSLLSVEVGEFVQIGEAEFRIGKVLTFEPDRSGEGLNFAPRVLMNIQDVAKTQVIQSGSRQSYFLLFAGNEDSLKKLDQWIIPQLNPTQKYYSPKDTRPTFRNLFDQGVHYLYLIVGVNFFLACFALSQVSRRFSRRQMHLVALLRCFGADFNTILKRYFLEISVLGLCAGVLGFLVSLTLTFFLKGKFESLFLQRFEIVWLIPAIAAFILTFAMILLFVILPLNDLRNITPLMIFRKIEGGSMASHPSIMTNIMNRIKWIFKKILMNTLGKLGVNVRYGINNLSYSLQNNTLQLIAFSFVMLGGWMIFLMRTDLIESWKTNIPNKAPNYFVINIPSESANLFQKTIQHANIDTQRLYPIIRGRLVSINNQVIESSTNLTPKSTVTTSNEKNRGLNRLLNLTYDSLLPKDNKIVAGEWFTEADNGKPFISVEMGFAERMNLKLGDKVVFQIADKSIESIVKSIRSVNWDTFYPNFFVIFPVGTIDALPKSYMTSFYINPHQYSILKKLIQDFPSISLIDITVILRQIDKAIQSLSLVIEFLWAFTAIMAVILLFCTITATLDERRQNAILFRALGVNNRRLRIILSTEFMILGFISGLIAIIGALALYAWISVKYFNLHYHFNAWLILIAPLLGLSAITLAGLLGIRHIFNLPPAQILSSRQGS